MLQDAVKMLKKSGAIRYDSDIARDLNHSKGNISSYLSGKVVPSENFLKQFYNFYKIQPPQTSTIDKILPPIENTENCQNILNALKTEVDGLKQLLDERERVITAQEKTIDVLMRTIDAVSTTNATPALVKSKKHA